MSPRLKIKLDQLTARIDARSLRERVLLFATAAAAIVVLLGALVVEPLLARRHVLQAGIAQQQNNIAGIDREIANLAQGYATDPDAAAHAELAAAEADAGKLAASLRAMQSGLVAPDRVSHLLDTILKANGRLQLVSMKTLAVSTVGAGAPAAQPAAGAAPSARPSAAPTSPTELLYRHGVELTVRGNYLDMVNYMDALEAMPTQLFWGQARLEVEEYPNARLTLTLYTLSLDRKWMKL